LPPEELEELDDDELELFPPEELDDELDELLDELEEELELFPPDELLELDELLEDELLDELDDDAITPLPEAPADEEDSDDPPPPPPQATNARGRLSINERNSQVRNKGIGENSRLGMAGAMVRR
jgi:hypothetical protein